MIDGALDLLSGSIVDSNTKYIAIEQICRAIFTMFNQRHNRAFPEEGNTLIGDIRLYKYSEGKQYTLLTHDEICEKHEHYMRIGKIKFENCEGAFIKFSFKALGFLSNLLKIYHSSKKLSDECLYDYNELKFKGQKPQFSFKLIDEAKCKLSVSNFKVNYPSHVAKYLYSMFDFKPLEKKIFILNGKAKGGKYSIIDGNKYRQEQIENIKKGKYKEFVNFRSKLTDDKTEKLVMKLAVENILIAKETFPSFKKDTGAISKAFYELICSSYGYKAEVFDKFIEYETSKVAAKTDSETMPDGSSVGKDSLAELLGLDG